MAIVVVESLITGGARVISDAGREVCADEEVGGDEVAAVQKLSHGPRDSPSVDFLWWHLYPDSGSFT